MSIVKLYTFVLGKLQAALVESAANATKRAEKARKKAREVYVKAVEEEARLENLAREAVIESTQLADRAEKLKALL